MQAKLAVDAPGDAYEQEADRAADQVLATPAHAAASGAPPRIRRLSGQSNGQRDVPAGVDRALAGAGSPLEPGLRQNMEQRFGHDFSAVRVHSDAAAASAADSIDALAFTAGTDVVFGRARYNPHTRDGRRLLAHELAHVVQQTGAPASHVAVQRKPGGQAKKKFYQESLDKVAAINKDIAQQKQSVIPVVIEPSELPILNAFVALCEAVDDKRTADIPKLLNAYVKVSGNLFPYDAPSESVMMELAFRLVQLGLDAESKKLRDHIDKDFNYADGRGSGARPRRLQFVTRLVTLALTNAKSATTGEIESSLDFMVRAFIPLRDALAEVHTRGVSPPLRLGGLTLKPGIDPADYYDQLVELVRRLFTGIEALLQKLTDNAAAELGAGKGSATLAVLDKMLNSRLVPALGVGTDKDIGDVVLEITRTQITSKGKGRDEDLFSKGADRSVPVTTFDPEQEFVPELKGTLEFLLEKRRSQVAFIAQIYGAADLIGKDQDKQGTRKKDAGLNAAAIKKLGKGGFSLHSNDDWRAFVVEKFDALTGGKGADKKSNEEAFQAIIDLLFAYLDAFTIHPEFTNIYDAGADSDNYLDKKFPRALSGQLLHDCGVYAVRVAYILSLVRDRLKLRFRFVLLPMHVILVIEGDKFPTYIVSNDRFIRLSPAKLAELRKTWDKTPVPKGTAKDDDQFIGEAAVAMYIYNPPDTPFVLKDVPAATGKASAAKKSMWEAYEKLGAIDLFGPDAKSKKSGNAGFEGRYYQLSQTDALAEGALQRFWGTDAVAAWNRFETKLIGAPARNAIPSKELLTLLDQYSSDFRGAFAQVDSAYTYFENEKKDINKRLSANPKLRSSSARLGVGDRAAGIIDALWRINTNQHAGAIAKFIADLKSQKERSVPLTEVRRRLAPPFIATDGKPLPLSELKQTP